MPLYRKADKRDAQQLAEIAERTFRDTFSEMNSPENMELHCRASYSVEIQTQEILDSCITTLIGEHESQFIGYLQLRWGSYPVAIKCAFPAEVQRLYVDQRWHGMGVAQNLMNEALRLAVNSGADQLWLGVWEHNPRAIAFYKKFGFAEAGEHLFSLGNDPQRDIIMIRPTQFQA